MYVQCITLYNKVLFLFVVPFFGKEQGRKVLSFLCVSVYIYPLYSVLQVLESTIQSELNVTLIENKNSYKSRRTRSNLEIKSKAGNCCFSSYIEQEK